MIRYVVNRLVTMVAVLLGISVVTFGITHVIPGDPARLIAGPHATQEQVQLISKQYGLDRSIAEQYVIYLKDMARGSLGESLTTRRPVTQDLIQFVPATAELAFYAMVLLVGVGIPLGAWAGARRGRFSDPLVLLGTVAAVSLPTFWLGMLLQLVFYRDLNWLPIGGRLELGAAPPPAVTHLYTVDSLLAGQWGTFQSAVLHLVLPVVSLAAGGMAIISRMTRSAMREAMGSDYVLTARSKGLGRFRVATRHGLRNSLTSTLTVAGLQVGAIFSGTVLVEVIFNWPGVGLYSVNAINNLDYSAIMGVTLLFAVAYLVVNLLVDIGYALLDPRVAYTRS